MIRSMCARSSGSRFGPECSRRSALALISMTGATLLSACSDTGADDDPRPSDGVDGTGAPDNSETGPVPDAEVLLATLEQTRQVLGVCSTVSATTSRRLTRICGVIQEQHEVFVRLIEAGGLEKGDNSAATHEPADQAASTTASDAATSPNELSDGDEESGSAEKSSTEDLSEKEAEAEAETAVATILAEQSTGAEIVATLVTVSAINLPTLIALHGHRAAAAEILGRPVKWPVVEGPLEAGAITILAGLRQAVYGLEVLVARSTEKEREAYNDALIPLREAARTVTELAGPAAPVAPLGYGLPGDVGTKKERQQLAKDLLSALPQAVIAGSAARAGDKNAIAGTLRLVSLSVRLGTSFRVPTAPFPGLTVPDVP